MKYTITIPPNMEQDSNAHELLNDVLQALLVLLEQKGQSLKSLAGTKITPELLEQLLLQQKKEKIQQPVQYSENKTAQAIFEHIDETGGLDGHSEKIKQLGREFREDFVFQHDQ